MAHRIENVAVRNFRSCTAFDFPLSDVTPLVGYNNAGKSNVLAALKWIVRPTALVASDFGNVAIPVQVEATIGGVTAAILHGLGDHEARITPFVANQTVRIRRTQNHPTDKLRDIRIELLNPTTGQWALNPAGISNALNALLLDPIQIGAMEDAAEDASKSRQTTTIGRLLAELVGPLEAQYGAQIEASLAAVEQMIGADGANRVQELTAFDGEVNQKLSDFFPGISIRVDLPTPEIKEVFKSGTIKVYEGNAPGRSIESYGHGAQRAIQMALIRHLADIGRGQGAVGRTLILIEEPELYLHPQAIEQLRAALRRLSTNGYQVVFSTHSPQMISAEDVADALIVRKSQAQGTFRRLQVRQAVIQTVQDHAHQADLLFSLQHASQILFCDKVVIAEGKTERFILPFLFEQVTNQTLGQARIAFVDLGGVDNVPKVLQILAALDLPTKAIVDLDFAFRGAIAGGLLPATDPDIAACKAYFQANAQQLNIDLDGSGLPRTKQGLRADQAYALLSAPGARPQEVQNIAQRLLAQQIWCWTKGSIEAPLGLAQKGNTANLSALKGQILGGGLDASVADPQAIRQLVTWLT